MSNREYTAVTIHIVMRHIIIWAQHTANITAVNACCHFVSIRTVTLANPSTSPTTNGLI